MITAVIGVVIAFNVAVYLMLASFLGDMKRRSPYADILELEGACPRASAGYPL
jgi:hypothetical protein